MSSKTTIEKELEVPVAIIAEVANLLCSQEITPEIIEADEKDETITLSVQFTQKSSGTLFIRQKTSLMITMKRAKMMRMNRRSMKEVLQGILVRLELIEQKLDKLQKAKEPLQPYLAAEQLLSAKDTAAYLHLSVARIYCLVCEGKLKPLQRKKRGRILFSQSLLDDYLSVNPRCS